ncbi:heat shock protein hsp28 [Cystoisospora suis]|uniref:Heat shock protein hsp28 n=1 Tax=Cystoisospora suis TaxID=483139 RepID=A0A2C6KTV3_9APIC|nr:heat shock protein hsp28 [Cystoisospora suis]
MSESQNTERGNGDAHPRTSTGQQPACSRQPPASRPSMMYPLSSIDRMYSEMMHNIERMHSEMEHLYQTHLAPSFTPIGGYHHHHHPCSIGYGASSRQGLPSYSLPPRQSQPALQAVPSSGHAQIAPAHGQIVPATHGGMSPFGFWGDIAPYGYRGGMAGHSMPRVDMRDTGAEFVVQADVPGMDKENLKVDVHDGVLTIRGEQREDRKQEDQGFYLQERSQASFSRSVMLPDKVKEDDIKASLVNGVLQVHIPKENPTAPPAVKSIAID